MRPTYDVIRAALGAHERSCEHDDFGKGVRKRDLMVDILIGKPARILIISLHEQSNLAMPL